MKTAIIAIVVVLLLSIVGPQALFTVDETQLAVVTRFGEIKTIHTSPGLKVKAPFIDSVNTFDRRVLRVDVPSSTLPDKEKEFLNIDAYARYQITDVRKFFEKLANLDRAEERIGRIVISALRNEIGERTKEEIIGARVSTTGDGERRVIPTGTRQEILGRVLAATDLAVKAPENDFGVAVLDVRIKRADFPEVALTNIFNRMISERERISGEFRAEGAREEAKIVAEVDRDKAQILAEAERQANLTRGEGLAEAIKILAEALEQDEDFYAFDRSLEAYRKFLSTNTTIILSSDSELFQFLLDPQAGFAPGTGQ